MDAVLQDSPFFDFGEDGLLPFPRTALHSIDGTEAGKLREQVRQYVPREPGVYGMLDPIGRLIYVGKSKCLRNRLLSYFLPNNEEDKAGRIVQSTQAIVWELQPSEFASLVREQFLIRKFQPRFNVQGIPRRQQSLYVCLGRSPAEQLYTAKRPDPKALYTLGPLAGAARANRAVDVLNRIFQLRDCSNQQPCSFTDQLQLFDIGLRPGCIRLEIETCLGPCISACSRKQYDDQVSNARDFLSGKSDYPLAAIKGQMNQASSNLHFEQATVLREDLRAIGWLHRRATDLARARKHYTFVYPVPSHDAQKNSRNKPQEVWYLIRRGIIEGAIAAPNSAVQLRQCHQLLRDWLASDQCLGTSFSPRPETLALVTSWFHKHRHELKRTFHPQKTPPPQAHRLAKSGKPATPKPACGKKQRTPNTVKVRPTCPSVTE